MYFHMSLSIYDNSVLKIMCVNATSALQSQDSAQLIVAPLAYHADSRFITAISRVYHAVFFVSWLMKVKPAMS